ncbi:MAG: hypothetical protein C4583_13400 [Anaerolineaceae bacterium]|nr:MAG: hypothetical protein C4583_13400 [Anaerolineaceae bacterium]
MSKKSVLRITLAFSAIAILGMITVLCALVILFPDDNQDYYNYPNFSLQPEMGSYLIDPETIFDSLNNGETDTFVPNLGQIDGGLPDVVFEKPINWKQSDYLMIAKALNQYVWKDTLGGWELYEMSFFLDCHDNPSGFERSFMTYFKTISSYGEKKIYAVRDFSILPKYAYVEWRGGKNYPRPLFGWKRIDFETLHINAEDALRIAEENGGKNIRLEFNNNCRIKVFLVPEINTRWRVWYSVEGIPELELVIDPLTGKIID